MSLFCSDILFLAVNSLYMGGFNATGPYDLVYFGLLSPTAFLSHYLTYVQSMKELLG